MARDDAKLRQPFACYDIHGNLYAHGVIYEQGNISCSFRCEIGETTEQWSSFGVFQATFHDKIEIIIFNQSKPLKSIPLIVHPINVEADTISLLWNGEAFEQVGPNQLQAGVNE